MSNVTPEQLAELSKLFTAEQQENFFKIINSKPKNNELKDTNLEKDIKDTDTNLEKDKNDTETNFEKDKFLGRLLAEECERNCMDNYPIDLSAYEKRLRTDRIHYLVAKAWKYTRERENSFCTDISIISSIVKRSNDAPLTENILQALTQSGKSKMTIIICYFASLAFGLFGAILVRNKGGSDHMKTLENNIDSNNNDADADDKKNINDLYTYIMNKFAEDNEILEDHETKFFKPSIYFRDDLEKNQKNGRINPFGTWNCPYILIDRQNVTTLDKLRACCFPKLGNVPDDIHYVGNKLRIIALFDEDDEAITTVNRNQNQTEKKSFCKDSLNGETIRTAPAILISISATIFSIAISQDKPNLNFPLIVHRMKIPDNYVGFYTSKMIEEVKERQKRKKENGEKYVAFDEERQIIKIIPTGYTLNIKNVYERDPGIKMALNDAVEKYNGGYEHINLLISTSKTKHRVNMQELVDDIICKHKNVPLIGFTHNMSNPVLTIHNDNDKILEFMREYEKNPNNIYSLVELNENCQDEIIMDYQNDKIKRYKLCYENNKKPTLRLTYSFIKLIYDNIGKKPFIVCVAGALCDRCVTYKTEDHLLPLTHMFYSSNSTISQTQLQQIFGRITGIDTFKRKRYMFTTDSCKEVFDKALKFAEEFVDELINSPDKKWTETLSTVDEAKNPNMAKIHEEQIAPMNFHRSAQAVLQDKIKVEYKIDKIYKKIYKDMRNIKIVHKIFKNHLFLSAEELTSICKQQNIFKFYDHSTTKPKPNPNKILLPKNEKLSLCDFISNFLEANTFYFKRRMNQQINEDDIMSTSLKMAKNDKKNAIWELKSPHLSFGNEMEIESETEKETEMEIVNKKNENEMQINENDVEIEMGIVNEERKRFKIKKTLLSKKLESFMKNPTHVSAVLCALIHNKESGLKLEQFPKYLRPKLLKSPTSNSRGIGIYKTKYIGLDSQKKLQNQIGNTLRFLEEKLLVYKYKDTWYISKEIAYNLRKI